MINKTINNSNWLSATLISILLFVGFIISTNLYFDHYQIFNLGLSDKDPINSNQRFNKIDYLDKHIGKYNAFIIGSSRIGHFPVDYLNEKSGKNYYNLNFFSGIPEEYLSVLKYLKNTGHPMDEVIIGLDLYPLFLPPDLSKPDFKHHPNISGKNSFEFMLDYLFQTSFFYLLTEYQYFFGNGDSVYEHTYDTGRYYPIRVLNEINKDPEKYWEQVIKKAEKKKDRFLQSDHAINPSQHKAILELIIWLNSESINFKIFIQPRHWYQDTFYKEIDISLLSSMLLLNSPDNLFNLNFENDLLKDNSNFYDLMHYRPIVAKSIIDQLFS